MTVRKRNIVLTIASAVAITIGVVWWLLRWNAEEYAVDEAVIREAFSGEDVSYYVILDSTRPNGRIGISGFHSEKLGVAPSARLSYTARNIFRFRLPSNLRLRLPHPYKLVDQESLDVFSRPSRQPSPETQELMGLMRRSWGVITLSRVGFDSSNQYAVVYAQLTYCGLCGEGTYLYLSKQSGGWHVVGRAGTWIS
jgi:hypothetical protein